jgi:hypothetical protein
MEEEKLNADETGEHDDEERPTARLVSASKNSQYDSFLSDHVESRN